MSARAALVIAVAAAAGASGSARAASAAAPDNVTAMAQFRERITRYAEQRDRLEAELPSLKPTRDADAIAAHERALAASVAAAREQDGSTIFDEHTCDLFRRLVADAVRGPGSTGARTSIMDENPGNVALAPNRPYPAATPLSTVPPAVLKALPGLPDDVEYRFVGRHLILRDTRANLIVDVVTNALP